MIKRIKSLLWDERVRRAGFLQSKQIITEPLILPIQLTKNIVVKYDSFLWVSELNLYQGTVGIAHAEEFAKAFRQDGRWPERIANLFDQFGIEVDDLVEKLQQVPETKKEKVHLFQKYVELLQKIQKYYVIAVPLTDFCERKITNQDILQSYAVPYKVLEIDQMQELLKRCKTIEDKDAYRKKHAWIKTSYNIIKEYTREDVEKELAHMHSEKKQELPKIPDNIKQYVVGLQVGIYLRNRMKELSQKLWFYVDNLAKSMAKDLNVARDDFFQLTYHEVVNSCEKDACVIAQEEFEKRRRGFVVGFVKNNSVLIAGSIADTILDMYSAQSGGQQVKGNTACRGFVQGKAIVILDITQVTEIGSAEVLVTRMTTPDFVPIMKQMKAVVTDEGGLSCHAAIVSRELNIPCIIGTKNATSIFKSGDVLEVDATNGIAKKL